MKMVRTGEVRTLRKTLFTIHHSPFTTNNPSRLKDTLMLKLIQQIKHPSLNGMMVKGAVPC